MTRSSLPMSKLRGSLAAVLALLSAPAWSVCADSQLLPAILDAENNAGTVIGLGYDLRCTRQSERSDADSESDALDADASIRFFEGELRARGVLTGDADENPETLQELMGAASYVWSDALTIKAGLFYRFEAEQSLDDRQEAFGARTTLGKMGLFADNDALALSLNLAQIDPETDTAREAVLTEKLEHYDRWDVELYYSYPMKGNPLEKISISYRYFREHDAPAAVRMAGLDRYRYSKITFWLKDELYLAYATGELPFDIAADQHVELGWSYSL
jgi:hypothetical protein